MLNSEQIESLKPYYMGGLLETTSLPDINEIESDNLFVLLKNEDGSKELYLYANGVKHKVGDLTEVE